MTASGILKCARCGKKILPSEAVMYLGTGDYHTSCVIRVIKEKK